MENSVPFKSAHSAADKFAASSYDKLQGEDLNTASQRLLHTVPMRLRKRGSKSSPRLNRSSTASEFGPMLTNAWSNTDPSAGKTRGIGYGNCSLAVYRKASAGRRWRVLRWRRVAFFRFRAAPFWPAFPGPCSSARPWEHLGSRMPTDGWQQNSMSYESCWWDWTLPQSWALCTEVKRGQDWRMQGDSLARSRWWIPQVLLWILVKSAG